ncbi:Bardet-Biedl syndrome 1 protein [Chytridiales sp. JEL 0842]|nr:Bardet-Biedl syndrome 1 protein [Chytridiales sp. JEL 0842]
MDYLILGTESKEGGGVQVVKPPAFEVVEKYVLDSPVAFLDGEGCMEGGKYHIIAATRDRNVYLLKPNVCNRLTHLTTPLCGLVTTSPTTFTVGCMSRTLTTFNLQGNQMSKIYLPAAISTISPFEFQSGEGEGKSEEKGVMVGLEGGDVRIYLRGDLITTLTLPGTPTSLHFGTYVRQPSALVCTLTTGALHVRILRRAALNVLLHSKSQTVSHTLDNTTPIPVPKKTKTYLSLCERERANAAQIHQQFERDVLRLRLRISKSYLHASAGFGTLPSSEGDAGFFGSEEGLSLSSAGGVGKTLMHIQGSVKGVGPVYVLQIKLRNLNPLQPATNIYIQVSTQRGPVKCERGVVGVGFVPPNGSLERGVKLVWTGGVEVEKKGRVSVRVVREVGDAGKAIEIGEGKSGLVGRGCEVVGIVGVDVEPPMVLVQEE